MALSFRTLAQGASTSDATFFDTGSFTPNANELVIAMMWSDQNSATATSAIVSGNGQTYTSIGSTLCDGNTVQLSAYRMLHASPSAGTVRFEFGTGSSATTQQAFNYCITGWTGVDTSGTNGSGAIVQSKFVQGSGVGTSTLTFDAQPTAGNGILAMCGHVATSSVVTGFTNSLNIAGNAHATPSGYVRSAYTIGSTTSHTDWNWGAANNFAIGQIEIKADTGVVPPTWNDKVTLNSKLLAGKVG